jgi:uncharacterized protein
MNREWDTPRRRSILPWLLPALLVLLITSRSIAGFVLDYQWWQELRQIDTWMKILLYRYLPWIGAAFLFFVVLWIAHARGLKHAGTSLSRNRRYAVNSTLVLLGISVILSLAIVDSWAIVRWVGSLGLADAQDAWRDPVFGKPLSFYFFDLPFYRTLLSVLLFLSIAAALLFWLTSRVWDMRDMWGRFQDTRIELSDLRLAGSFNAVFLRVLVAIFLIALAVKYYLDRYDFLFEDHGSFVGVDWVAENLGLPLQWLLIAAAIGAAGLVLAGRMRWALAALVVFPIQLLVPAIVSSVYVSPNEIAIQRPYIQRHIEATRSAFALDQRARSIEYTAQREARIDVDKNRALFENILLWDWRPFRDTVTQVQPLRPFTYSDIDVDRYTLGGKLQQVLLAPREMQLQQLDPAARRWINLHFTFTHGYGLVLAEANKITPAGLPVFFIQDAPPEISVPELKLTRPEIYYGEQSHDPVFVRTNQPEFSYPSGSQDISSKYAGQGGFPISSFPLRLMAAVYHGDYNIALTGNITDESRMMMRRRVDERLQTLAGFVTWDRDPYLVLTNEGRMVWMADGYMTSDAHPYARHVSSDDFGRVNFIRNSVKATVDAYDGVTRIYVFDESDPLVRAYRNLFPALFQNASEMPADLRAHARVPETMFRVQAEMYRAYHMRDPESFYNRADLWDLPVAGGSTGGGLRAAAEGAFSFAPTYIIAKLPGETQPEFLLTIPFVPHNKQNLIGMMVARCDGEKLGELVYINVGRQDIIPGPNQVEANISQDQNIAKDLSLWNQQGSQVLRGQTLIIPVDGSFVYVAPIYIQASEAKMPQLKKVAIVNGNSIFYRDTFDQALADLRASFGTQTPAEKPAEVSDAKPAAGAPAVQQPASDARIEQIRRAFERYRTFTSQGKWAEAGRELENIEALVRR